MEFKATEIAGFLNGENAGDGITKNFFVSIVVEGIPGSLALVANIKYNSYICETLTSVVLIHENFMQKKEITATLIKVDDTYRADNFLREVYVQEKSDLNSPALYKKLPLYIRDFSNYEMMTFDFNKMYNH